MVKVEYFPKKRGKSHDFLIYNLTPQRIKLSRGLNDIAESDLAELNKIASFQDFIEKGAIVVHQKATKTVSRSSKAKEVAEKEAKEG